MWVGVGGGVGCVHVHVLLVSTVRSRCGAAVESVHEKEDALEPQTAVGMLLVT